MCRGGELQAPSDDCAVQDRNDRHLAELHGVVQALADLGSFETLGDRRLLEFIQVQPSAEVLAGAVHHHRLDVRGDRGEECLQAQDQLVAERIALLRTIQRHDRNRVTHFHLHARGQRHGPVNSCLHGFTCCLGVRARGSWFAIEEARPSGDRATLPIPRWAHRATARWQLPRGAASTRV